MICFCNGKNNICADDSKCVTCMHYNGEGCTYIKTNMDLIKALPVESLSLFLADISGDKAGGTSVLWERWLRKSIDIEENAKEDVIVSKVLEYIEGVDRE